HIPATIAQIPSQTSIDILIDALQEPDGFLRYKVVAAIEKIRGGDHTELMIRPDRVEALALKEAVRYFNYLTLHYNLFLREDFPSDSLLAHALQEKIRRTMDRVYRLLGLLYPWKDIAAARWAIERGGFRARASALEYLDNMLGGPLRRRLMPMLEEAPVDEKVRKANVILKTRPRDAAETLVQLINDDDEVVAAAAIDLIEERKIWTLADDVEHVLAHRDSRDWYVFEAASWTLAAHRMPASRRRALWREPLPAVQLAGRLRHIPLFGSVSIDELFRIAGTGRQIRYETGQTLFQEGVIPAQIHFLLDGAVSVQREGSECGRIEPPAALGIEPVLQGSAMRETIRTLEPTACLALSTDEVRTLVSDNTELVQGLFRTLATRALPPAARLVVKGGPGAAAAVASFVAEGLKPIGKVLVLEQIHVFGSVSAGEMLHLASIARPVALREGATLVSEAEAPAIVAILEGRVSLESRGGGSPAIAEAGDAIGVLETLSGVGLECKAVVVHGGRALKIEREDLFDLLGQRPVLLQQLFAGLLGMPGQQLIRG
ncbi:MAG: cyclic nucleotide-binding domain-containing protein, partial [Gaiellales bacterium]